MKGDIMKITINLGAELAVFANEITNVFTTKDYVLALQDQYVGHVKGEVNDFSHIKKLYSVIGDLNFKPTPCDTPLEDIRDAKEALYEVVNNRPVYSHVIGMIQKSCTGDAGGLVKDLLEVLNKSSKEFHETALRYDRYMGNDLSVAEVLIAVQSYGRLSGLVDYYNFKEGKA